MRRQGSLRGGSLMEENHEVESASDQLSLRRLDNES